MLKMRAAIENAIIAVWSGQPAGVETLTFGEDNSLETNSDFTFADLVALESLIGEDFERNAVFVMNRKTLAKIKNLKDDAKRPSCLKESLRTELGAYCLATLLLNLDTLLMM